MWELLYAIYTAYEAVLAFLYETVLPGKVVSTKYISVLKRNYREVI